MAKYLDPKADLTFKKVFAEHKDLMISFLNALLPLDEHEQVVEIEYLPFELVPDNPLLKDTIVDVRCTDQLGRSFIVEMQMIWSPEFMKRVLFNASKSYSRQLDKGGHYADLQPVYSLNLVNDVFRNDTEEYYHDYGLMDIKYKNHVIEGIHLVFIELPKFKLLSLTDKRMAVLWLRFLTEIDERTKHAPQDLMDNPKTRKALDLVEESAYTEAQMNTYDHFWDMVSTERTYIVSAMRQGMKKGMKKGMEKGMKKGMEKGMKKGKEEGKTEVAKNLLSLNVPMKTIQMATGLSEEEINKLRK